MSFSVSSSGARGGAFLRLSISPSGLRGRGRARGRLPEGTRNLATSSHFLGLISPVDGAANALLRGMMLILEAIIGAYAVGFTAMFVMMRQAPEGYEDQEGFHIHWKNNDPEVRDVACVWVTAGGLQ